MGALRSWGALLLLVFAMTAAGCPEDTPTPGTTAPVERDKVRVGRLICGGHLSLAVVEHRYQDELRTFELETVQNHDWRVVAEALRSGTMDGTFILSPLAMELIRSGLEAKIVLLGDRNGNGFVLSEELASVSALAGRRSVIAVPHIFSQHNVLLYEALTQNSVPRADVSVIAMPPRDMINSLRRGEIDGFVVGEPEGNKSVSLEVGRMTSISPQIWPGHPDHVLLVTDQFIEGHPEQLQELVDMLVRAGRFIEANPRRAAQLGQEYTGSRSEVFEQVLTSPPNWIEFGDMTPTMADIEGIATRLVAMDLWREVPADLDSFIDLRFVERASRRSWDD